MQIALTALHQRDKHGHPIAYLDGLPPHDAALTPSELRRLARQLITTANDADQGELGTVNHTDQE